MHVRDLQARAFATAEAHGFWDDWHALDQSGEHRDRGRRLVVDEKLALIHSELSEALEEVRDAGSDFDRLRTIRHREDGKPEGFAVELADAIVRIADLADALGVNLTTALEEKMAFNETRPPKHGREC